MEVRINTDEPPDTEVTGRNVGEIEIRGTSLMTGYIGQAPINRQDWLPTGDLGYLTDEGLVVCGRAKELITVAGRNVFPTEIFSQLAVRKTPSADVEEGSLGATVDLRSPRPFDYADNQAFSITARGIYNEVSEEVDPRVSLLAGKKFFDDTFGVLATFSCSHHVTPALFEEVCRAAAGDAGVEARVLATLGQSADHPVLLTVPESRYLTGLLLQAR